MRLGPVVLQSKDSLRTKRGITLAVLGVALVGALAAILYNRFNVATYLGGVVIPPQGSGVVVSLVPSGNIVDGTVSVSQDLVLNVVMQSGQAVPVSSAEATVQFDPTLFTVSGTPTAQTFSDSIYSAVDATSGLVTIVGGTAFPGQQFEKDQRYTLSTIRFVPKKTGTGQIAVGYGSARNSGPSHVIVTDNQGVPVDILDAVQNFSVNVSDTAPVITAADGLFPEQAYTNLATPTRLTILGRFFGRDSVVRFSSASGAAFDLPVNFLSDDGTKAVTTVPANYAATEGSYAIGVVSGGKEGWKQDAAGNKDFSAFRFSPQSQVGGASPIIGSISPTNIVANNGAQQNLVITGSAFKHSLQGSVTAVDRGQVVNEKNSYNLSHIAVNEDGTVVNATVDELIAPGVYDVQLGFDDGAYGVVSAALTASILPSVVRVEPSTMTSSASKATVVIRGTDFGLDASKVAVALVGQSTVPLTIQKLEKDDAGVGIISAVSNSAVPAGTYDLKVTVNGISGLLSHGISIVGSVAPKIDGMFPTSLPQDYANNTQLVINGTSLNNLAGVELRGTNGQKVTLAVVENKALNASDDFKVIAAVPAGAPVGDYSVAALMNDGSVSLLENIFSITPATPVPQIADVNPRLVYPDYTTSSPTLTILGSGFGTKPRVVLKGYLSALLTITEASDTRIVGTLPSGLQNYKYDIFVTVNDKTGVMSQQFEVAPYPAPVVTSITPNRVGPNYPTGTTVVVNGSGFGTNQSAGTTVRLINGTQNFAQTNVSVESSKITIKLSAALPSAKYDVSVRSNGKESILAQSFEVTTAPIPTISVVAPASVTQYYPAGVEVNLTGYGFGTAPTVQLISGTKTVTPIVKTASDTAITIGLPIAMSNGKYDIKVTASNVTGTLVQGFEVIARPSPTISAVTPNMLDQTYSAGTAIKVTGTNFFPSTQVRIFNADQSYDLNNESQNGENTEIKAELPQAILPGVYDVQVYSASTEPRGSLPQSFTLKEVPLHVLAPVVTNTSNPKFSTQLSASWTLPENSAAPLYYQYRILDNGNEIRAWDADKIQLATQVTATGLNLQNGHTYTIQVRGVSATGPGDVTTSTPTVTASANLDHDAAEKVGLYDLQLLGRSFGRKDKPMADINQNGIVSLDDLGILLSSWNP